MISMRPLVVWCLYLRVWVVKSEESSCSLTQFRCGNGKCIPQLWKCDKRNDCGDQSDEDPGICPDVINCRDTEFTCGNGKCIPKRWTCDNEEDCEDASDEALPLCDRPCKPDEFTCHNENTNNCIPLNWVCDGSPDCADKSDEKSCDATRTSKQFTCANGKCISKRWRCDGDKDCGGDDTSDEENCPCTPSQVQCGDGSCIDRSWQCDGNPDCINGTDEQNCTRNIVHCNEDEYSCKGHLRCIKKEWLCDQDLDCPHGDDEREENCNKLCPTGSYTCGDNSCIPENLKCNGLPECADHSDEKNCTKPASNEDEEFNFGECGVHDGCQQNCVNTQGGHICTCDKGYSLVNKTKCDDIDECLEPGICSQLCFNLKGGFKCECVQGYARDPHNKHGCKAMEGHASLLFAHYSDIRKISLDHQEFTSIVNETRGSTTLDFVFKTGMIFWSDVRDDVIYKAPIDEGSNKQVVVDINVTTVDGLAVDWIYSHIYWTNTDTDTIEVAEFNGDLRRTLIQDNLDEPRAIAVNPSEGWMFWTDWGDQAKIERCGMDGSHREAIVTHDIKWPNSLTLDLVLHKVYWCDSKFHSIYSANFDGSQRRTILHSMEYLPHPFSLTVFEDTMYWADWQKEAIIQANKFTGKGVKIFAQSLPTPMTVHVYHSYRQPNGTNHCRPLNGLCTHLCLPAPQITPLDPKKTCACPDGLILMSDGLTCGTVPAYSVAHVFMRVEPPELLLQEHGNDNYTIREGAKVTLTCEFTYNGIPWFLKWTHPAASNMHVFRTLYKPNAQLGHWSEIISHELQIQRLQIRDSGEYSCFRKKVVGGNYEDHPPHTILLRVVPAYSVAHVFVRVEPPELLLQDHGNGNYTIKEGAKVTLTCEVTYTGKTWFLKWTHPAASNMHVLHSLYKPNAQGGHWSEIVSRALQIQRVLVRDSGEYSCFRKKFGGNYEDHPPRTILLRVE